MADEIMSEDMLERSLAALRREVPAVHPEQMSALQRSGVFGRV